MPRPASILVIEDGARRLEALSIALEGMGHRVTAAADWPEALARLKAQAFNVVLTGTGTAGVSGVEMLEAVKEINPEVAVIMLTDPGNLEAAVNALDEWGDTYVLSSGATCRVKTLIDNAVREQELLARNRRLVESLQRTNNRLEKANRALEQASRAKSDFLAKMSHELRTPLNVIIGFAQLMLDQVPGGINEEQRQCLDDILGSGQHLLGLINEVLDLARVEAGRVRLKLNYIALPELVASVGSTMAAVFSPKKQRLGIELEEGLPPVLADKARLRQVFFNLLSNASKFTPDGGEITITAVRRGGWCQVSVSDNGIGIKEEDMGKLFEPFSQAGDATLEVAKGTGLGLALVKEIIEQHHGRVWLESEYGSGSRFIFTLPLMADKPLPVEAGADEGTHRRR